MAKVCYDNMVDDIRSEDYKSMEKVVQITGPIRRFELKLQQESVPTISLVYSGIAGILQVLEQLKVNTVVNSPG